MEANDPRIRGLRLIVDSAVKDLYRSIQPHEQLCPSNWGASCTCGAVKFNILLINLVRKFEGYQERLAPEDVAPEESSQSAYSPEEE